MIAYDSAVVKNVPYFPTDFLLKNSFFTFNVKNDIYVENNIQ